MGSNGFLQLIGLLRDKDSLTILQNIAESVNKIINSEAVKTIANMYAISKQAGSSSENSSTDIASVLQQVEKYVAMAVKIRDALTPLFGNKKGQYSATSAIIDNFIDLSKRLDSLLGIVVSADSLWQKVTETSIYKAFSKDKKDESAEKKEGSGFDLQKITDWVDGISEIVGKLHKSKVVDKIKDLIDSLGKLELGKLVGLVESADEVFKKLQSSSLMNLFSGSDKPKDPNAPKMSVEEQTSKVLEYIEAANKILKAVNGSNIVESLHKFISSIGNEDFAKSIRSAVDPIMTMFNLYLDIKGKLDGGGKEVSTSGDGKFDSDKIVEYIKGGAKILDVVVKKGIASKLANVAKSITSSHIAEALGDPSSPDSLFSKLKTMVVGIASLKNVIKENFGSSEESSSEGSALNIDEVMKYVDFAMPVIQKVNTIIDFISKNDTIGKAAAEIDKLNGAFSAIATAVKSFRSLFGGSSGSSGSGSGEPLSKTLDSATTTIVAFDNLLSTIDSFDWHKLMANLAKIVNNVIITPVNKLFKTINEVSDKIVSIINKLVDTFQSLLIKIARIQNKTIELINKLPGVDIKWRAEENLDFSDYKLENKIHLNEIPEVHIEVPQELSQSSSEQISTDTINEMSKQGAAASAGTINEMPKHGTADSKLVVDTINMLRKEISKLSESNAGSFSDVNGNLANINSALQTLVAAQANKPSPALNTAS